MSVVTINETEKYNIPAKALEITDLVAKKKRALVIKYSVKNSYEPVPNLLEIKESVQKEEVSFMRRMDKVLHKDNAYLLPNLKQDLHIENHNYLREISEKTKKNRRYLKESNINGKEKDSFVYVPCQLSTREWIV